jgi:hypothetical protein
MGTKHGTHRDFTLDEHLELAEEICLALKHFTNAYKMCQKRLGQSNRITQSLHNLVFSYGLSGGSKVIKRFKEELHSKYDKLVDDETYSKYGLIYHGQRRDKK